MTYQSQKLWMKLRNLKTGKIFEMTEYHMSKNSALASKDKRVMRYQLMEFTIELETNRGKPEEEEGEKQNV